MKCKKCRLKNCECFYTCLSCFEHAGNCRCPVDERSQFKKLSPDEYMDIMEEIELEGSDEQKVREQ